MRFTATSLSGVYRVEPELIEDERGFWMVRAGDLVTVMLTVETVGAQGQRMRTTLDTAVLMKN